MYAADFRAAARRALSGKWFLSVVAGLIALMVGAISYNGPELEFKFDTQSGVHATFGNIPLSQDLALWIAGAAAALAVSALIMGLVYYTIGSVVTLGYARFNLELIDGGNPELGCLFSYFSWFKTAFCARFLTSLYVLLWSLLLIIPGILASYSYALVPYILAERPELTASEAIRRSKDLMYGNRWRLFCLQFSFIGWSILCALTLGIGNLWLTPYSHAATAAFYRDLTAFPSLDNRPHLPFSNQ